MIKVVLLIPTLDLSGAEKQLTLLATRLPRDEFEVHVVALTRGGPFESQLRESGIPVTILGKRWKFDPLAFWKLSRVLADYQPDILHTWLFAANSYGRLAAAKQPRPRIVVSERCVDTWKSGWQFWLDRKLISRTTRLIGNSQSVAQFYAGRGFPSERITVITNGVDIPERLPIDREQTLSEFDIPVDARVVGYVGRLARQKRVNDLIWATELLDQMDPNVFFLIVGDGPQRDNLRGFARQIGLADSVRFAQHRDDVSRLLPLFDVFWLASDFEGQSNSLMEAMAAGIPVVVSDIPPNRELVCDGKTGFLVPVGDGVVFAKHTARLLADRQVAEQMGQAGRERMRSKFSVEKMVGAHADLYRAVVEES